MVRFAADLAAAKERRSLSSLIEWAVCQALQKIVVATPNEQQISALDVAKEVWNEDEIVRLFLLAERYPTLLTTEQRQLLDLIYHNDHFVISPKSKAFDAGEPMQKIRLKEVRLHWQTLKRVVAGDLPRSKLPAGEEILVGVPSDSTTKTSGKRKP